jgi:protein gp37
MTPRERPILFSDEMVRAILDGKKTQTRRVVKPRGEWIVPSTGEWAVTIPDMLKRCPYGVPGDRLWVRRERRALDRRCAPHPGEARRACAVAEAAAHLRQQHVRPLSRAALFPAPQHTFQVLTKRPARMLEFMRRMPAPPPHVWLGVSVEDQRAADERIPLLLETPAALRFLSVEPVLGPIYLAGALSVFDRHGEPSGPRCNDDGTDAIGWIIVGGESGPGARPCDVAWIRSVVEQCRDAAVPCFVKQLGARPGSVRLVDRKGGDMSEWPADIRVRQFPEVR